MPGLTLIFAVALCSGLATSQYTATYLPTDAPPMSEDGQYGTNQCGGGSNQTSLCQNAYINGVDDFCLWAPPDPNYEGQPSLIANTEQVEVSWCLREGYGTRLIPNGAITGAHFIQAPNYVQILGIGDMTKLSMVAGDDGGELDPHGYDGSGNPIGGLVFGTSFGELQQYHEWTSFIWYGGFCFRACIDGPDAPTYCNHIYDTLGCGWNMPGDYTDGVFDSCLANNTEPMGVYVSDGTTTTFHQGDPTTPDAHDPAPSSQCTTFSSVSNAPAMNATATLLPSSVSASLASITASQSSASLSSVRKTSSTTATATASGSRASGSTGPTASGSSSSAVSSVLFIGQGVWFVAFFSVAALVAGVLVL